jgi:hypothetical protein
LFSALDGDVDQQTTEQLLAVPNDGIVMIMFSVFVGIDVVNVVVLLLIERREMLSDLQRKTLGKQGYQV